MALYIKGPDSGGNCCECSARAAPCDSCSNCGVCSYECISNSSGFDCRPSENGAGTLCSTRNAIVPGCDDFPTQHIIITSQVRLVITGLTAGVETNAYVYFSDSTNHRFTFTPTSSSYTTEYVDIPNPALNAADISVTGCSVACPGNCQCGLAAPNYPSSYFTEIYQNYDDAANAIIDYVGDCYLFGYGTGGVALDSLSFTSTSLITAHLTSSLAAVTSIQSAISITLEAGASITFSGSVSTSGADDPTAHLAVVSAVLYYCDGTQVDSDSIIGTVSSQATGSFTLNATDAGEYMIVVYSQAYSMTPSGINLTYTVTPSGTFVANPAKVLWQDGSNIRTLEACPKFLIPPLTESGGDWYANQSEAQTAINDLVSNCIAWFGAGNAGYFSSYSATSSTTSIDISVTTAVPNINTGQIFFSVNALKDSQILFSFSASNGAKTAFIRIYDYDGIEIFSQSSSSNITSSALPYTGKYIVFLIISTSSAPTGTLYSGTVSGITSVNNIQALYDVGLDCPARLNCT